MKKTYSIMFDKEFISLKATDSPTIVSTRLNHILSKLKNLHHDHTKSFAPGKSNFEIDTKDFLQQIVKCHINDHTNGYLKRYFGKGIDPLVGWENLLSGILEEIEYQIEIDQDEEDTLYRHKIKIISCPTNIKEHSIKLLIINMETESILRVNIILERNVKVIRPIISVKVGSIVFEPEE